MGHRDGEAAMDEQSDLLRVAGGLTANARDLEAELGWLARVLEARLAAYFGSDASGPAAVCRSRPPTSRPATRPRRGSSASIDVPPATCAW